MLPGNKLPARRLDDPLAGGMYESAGFENAQKTRRWQQSKAWMLPAQQRFKTNQATAVDVDTWLVVQHELVANQRVPQAHLKFFALLHAAIKRRRIILKAPAAMLFRLLHGHFRGFDEYWQIPASEPTAVAGEWVSGPGRDFFDRVAESITSPAILVEDLGEISDAVEALRDDLGYPGMKVVQFGFSDPESPHLPHNFASDNCVVYSGTHDNDTTLGWWKGLDRKERDEVRRVLGRPRLGKARATDAVDAIVHYVFASLARLAVVPMQDLLCLDSAARLNLPGKMRTSNWQWQMAAADLSSELAATTRARLIGLNRLGEAGEESERL